MEVFYDVAFRALDYDATLGDGPELPGRQLAEDIAASLRELGRSPLGVFNEEPFWAIRFASGSRTLDVLVGLYLPDEERDKAIWWVSVPSSLGFFDRLFRKAEGPSTILLLEAINAALQSDDRIRDVRWFKELPAEPYESSKYSNLPTATV